MEPISLSERLGRWSSGRGPLYVLLAARLRRLIDDGDLPPGLPLPTDRALAGALAVGRNTAVAAYDLLRAEGRIVRRQGSGTRVAGAEASPAPHAPGDDTTASPVFLHLLESRDDGVLLLACASPDSPPPELVEAYARMIPALAATGGDIGYHPAGHMTLRRAIAEHYEARGLPTGPAQIMVTNGGQQALSLLARAFVRPGEHVLLERPTYPGALEAFREQSAVLRTLPVGLDGFEQAIREHRPALAYVIPTYQNPTGAVLSPLVRRRLAERAAAANVPLIDDEVLAGLGFPGEERPPPLPGAVIVDSLSKGVWGGLRIGWVRAPEPVVARLARLRAVHDLGGDVPTQLAAADLLPRLETIRARRAAGRRLQHDRLRAELARLLPSWDVPAVRGGQTLWVRLPHGDATSFAQVALRHGVAVLPGGGLDASGGSHDFVRIHFLASAGDLTEAARRLARAWTAYDPRPTPVTAPAVLAV